MVRPHVKSTFQLENEQFVLDNQDLVNALDENARNLVNLHFGLNPTGRFHSTHEMARRVRMKRWQIGGTLRKIIMRLKAQAKAMGRSLPTPSVPTTKLEVYGTVDLKEAGRETGKGKGRKLTVKVKGRGGVRIIE